MRKQTKLVAVLSAAALLAIGASMTSFAAGWTQEDGTWVYLDRDGDRVTEEWKKSGANYYWLNDDGEMATNALIEDDDEHYYVDANGVRVSNQWVSVDNIDDDEVDGKEVDVLWYYMGSSGKAYKASGNNEFKNTTINGKRYLFDEDGHMVSGWTYVGDDTYYLGNENEGWAYTDWQYLEIDEDEMTAPDGDYENDEAWFNFKSTGKARKNTRAYISGAYYTFDENGVMLDDWVSGTPGTADSKVATENRTFYNYDDGHQASGWVYTYQNKDKDGDQEWYYMVSGDKNAAFNSSGKESIGSSEGVKYKEGLVVDKKYDEDVLAAKVIKGKTYLFDNTGKMLTGVFMLGDTDNDGRLTGEGGVKRQGGSGTLAPGFYYFNKSGGSVQGQMETGKVTINYDGEDWSYYFDGAGRAYSNIVKDSVLYGRYGYRLEADDGNSYRVVNIHQDSDIDWAQIGNKYYVNGTMIVSSSGKVKKSGTVTIDGVKYVIGGEYADGSGKAPNYFVSNAYDKDDDDKTLIVDLERAVEVPVDAE